MADYDFSTLNSTDLEELVCDLMNLKEPEGSIIKYRTFKEGRDQGIDFLYSTETKDFSHVGQVKHYYRTGLKKLIELLIKEEADKVTKLNPDKYIFATSVDISAKNAQVIKSIFDPFIRNIGDIYGKSDLNRLIEDHDEILKRHYKLWFSDASVLELILKSDLEFKSSVFEEFELKRRLRLFVETESFQTARESLQKNRFIVITGDPGVGKTTLAEMLTYEYLKEGFELTYIDEIGEADRVLRNDDSKQIIYFDDFLGSNKVEINKAKGSETQLRRILSSVGKLQNKILIMTTRIFLLNTAILESENLDRFNIKAKESTLKVEEYNTELKERLVLNHVEDSDISEVKKMILKEVNLLQFMVNHEFFTPRTVEFVTSENIVSDIEDEKFEEFVRENFNSPDKIWSHAYHEQISKIDRLFLNTLFSFKNSPSTQLLEKAFNSRLELEEKTGLEIESNAFKKCVKRLLGGFITERKPGRFSFINPSLRDFLISEITSDSREMKKISEALIYIDQLKVISDYYLSIREPLPELLKETILRDYSQLVDSSDDDIELIYFSAILADHFDLVHVDQIIHDILDDIYDWEGLLSDYEAKSKFELLLTKVQGFGLTSQLIESNLLAIIEGAVLNEFDPKRALDSIESISGEYGLDLGAIDTSTLDDHISTIINEKIDQEVEFLKDYARDESEAGELVLDIEGLVEQATELGLKVSADFNLIHDNDWWEIAMNNEIRIQMEKDD